MTTTTTTMNTNNDNHNNEHYDNDDSTNDVEVTVGVARLYQVYRLATEAERDQLARLFRVFEAGILDEAESVDYLRRDLRAIVERHDVTNAAFYAAWDASWYRLPPLMEKFGEIEVSMKALDYVLDYAK